MWRWGKKKKKLHRQTSEFKFGRVKSLACFGFYLKNKTCLHAVQGISPTEEMCGVEAFWVPPAAMRSASVWLQEDQ